MTTTSNGVVDRRFEAHPGNDAPVYGILVTFEPDRALLEQSVDAALKQLHGLIVVDNSVSDGGRRISIEVVTSRCQEFITAPERSRVVHLKSGGNIGLSKAYNVGIAHIPAHSESFVLLLDQDSALVDGAVTKLLSVYNSLSLKFGVGAVCARNIERHPPDAPFLEVLKAIPQYGLRSKYAHRKYYSDGSVHELRTFTNSGSMIPFERFSEVGMFDENLFIDAIDYEFSLRLAAHGYRIFMDDDAKVLHTLGTPYSRSILGREVQLRTFSATRGYYIVRDTIRFSRRWLWSFPRTVAGILVSWAAVTIGSILLLPGTRERLRAALRGLLDS